MPTQRIEIAPELVAEGKRLYETTDLPIHDIAARMGLTRGTLNNRIREWKWTRRRYSASVTSATAPISPPPAAAVAFEPTASVPAADAPPLPFAAWKARVIAAEMAAIDRTLAMLGPASSAEAERTARILAMITRTVQDIQTTAEGQTSTNETDDDPVPSDIDEFRLALAQRIRAFIAGKRRSGADGGVSDDPEAPVG